MSGWDGTFPVIDDGGSTEQPKGPLDVWRYCVRSAAHYEQQAEALRDQGRLVDAAIEEKRAEWSRRFANLWEGFAKETRKEQRP